MCRCVCICLKTALDGVLEVSNTFWFWDGLSLACYPPGRLGWLPSKLQGSSYLCLPSTGITNIHRHANHAWLFKCQFWGLNSGAHACMASSLFTLIFPHQQWIFDTGFQCVAEIAMSLRPFSNAKLSYFSLLAAGITGLRQPSWLILM